MPVVFYVSEGHGGWVVTGLHWLHLVHRARLSKYLFPLPGVDYVFPPP